MLSRQQFGDRCVLGSSPGVRCDDPTYISALVFSTFVLIGMLIAVPIYILRTMHRIDPEDFATFQGRITATVYGILGGCCCGACGACSTCAPAPEKGRVSGLRGRPITEEGEPEEAMGRKTSRKTWTSNPISKKGSQQGSTGK
jgi:hypothetical protein